MNIIESARKFWRDDGGAILSAELVVISTVLVLGLIVGLSAVQNAIVNELFDISQAFCSLNQNFFVRGFRGCKSFTGSSGFFRSSVCGVCAANFNNFGTTFGTGFDSFGGPLDFGIGGGFVGGGSSVGGFSSSAIIAPPVAAPAIVAPSTAPLGPELCPPQQSAPYPPQAAPCPPESESAAPAQALPPVPPRPFPGPPPMHRPGHHGPGMHKKGP